MESYKSKHIINVSKVRRLETQSGIAFYVALFTVKRFTQ